MIGMALEKAPLPSNTPVLLVVHSVKGVARFVDVSQV
jgi:hypothetical protein